MATSTRIGNGHLSVEVSALGAEMQSLTTHDGRSWLWSGDAAFWTGRSPVLFPIVGKAPDDHVSIDGVPYSMAQHGFARRREFSLAASNESMCRYVLTTSEETKAIYPFDFELAVEHAVKDRTLAVTAEVVNRGNKSMPFGLGFHPAFLWPLPGAQGREHTIVLDNGAEPALVRLEGGLVRPEKLPSPFRGGRLVLDHPMFDHDAMIFPTGAGSGLSYSAQGGPTLRFSFENLPNLALWSKPGAPFICIEPWHGTAAELNGSADLSKRPYSVALPARDSARFGFTVEVSG